MELKIVTEDKYLPKYANATDACMDIKAKIEKDEFGDETVCIQPGEVALIHTGLKVAIPEGYVMQMFVRSSTGIKRNLCLANGTGIIDAGYRDEIMIALYNFGKMTQWIQDGDRICQFILLPFPKIELKQVEDNEEFRNGDRGGGIGSSGK